MVGLQGLAANGALHYTGVPDYDNRVFKMNKPLHKCTAAEILKALRECWPHSRQCVAMT